MKLFCPISGVSYTTDVGYGHGQAPHPIFYFSLEQLTTQLLAPYTEGKLAEQEIHLLGCALLRTLPVKWEVAIEPSESMCKNWRRNMEKLAAAALWHDSRNNSHLASYRIDKNNRTLHNLKQFLDVFISSRYTPSQNIEALITGSDPQPDLDAELDTHELAVAEEKIVATIRSALDKAGKKKLPYLVAQWAASVGSFPTSPLSYPVAGGTSTKQTTVRAHWQQIIVKAFETTNYVELLSDDISLADISELVEHCETEIEVGTLHYSLLMKKLRAVKNVIEEFTSPAPMSQIQIVEHHAELAASLLGETSNAQLTDSTSLAPHASATTTTKVSGTGASAPTSAPLRKDYPSNASYLAAKLRYSRSKTNAQ